MFKESTIKVAGKVGKKPEKAKSDKPSTAKSGQKSEKKVRIELPAPGMLPLFCVCLFGNMFVCLFVFGHSAVLN